MKLTKIAQCIALMGVAGVAFAQSNPGASLERVEITGSSIKRIASEGALPIQVITAAELVTKGIVTGEQLMESLNSNGNGLDNLASTNEISAGVARGDNGRSSANLRGQGASGTLVLLNGRRIATHGLKGQSVDLNAIPMAAVERIEILKDGASAIYGTDAIGGVINFILKKNFQGLSIAGSTDVTQGGGGAISRVSGTFGAGDINTEGYNFLATLTHRKNEALWGSQRGFVDTYQNQYGIAADTRGHPFATIAPSNAGTTPTVLGPAGTTGVLLQAPNFVVGQPLPTGTQRYDSINVLNLPGGFGGANCQSYALGEPYDFRVWAAPQRTYACGWDAPKAAAILQPVNSTDFVTRFTKRLGDHNFNAEFVASQTDLYKSYTANQLTPGFGSTNPSLYYYPSTGSAYNAVFNALKAVFPYYVDAGGRVQSIQDNFGRPIAYRWRFLDGGNRQEFTKTDAARAFAGLDGVIGAWDYKVGLSQATSKSSTTLGSGYYLQTPILQALGSGLINPFLLPGQSQSQTALDTISAASASGTLLFAGKSTVTQLDANLSGGLFSLPAGEVMSAAGVDIRREQFSFLGDQRDPITRPTIMNAPFDNGNAITDAQRDIFAVYAELLVPVTKQLETTIAVRRDRYSGIGETTNPKVSFRYAPVSSLLFRGSYNTGFRAPAFNQLFNPATFQPFAGADQVDPQKCPTLRVDTTKPGCENVTPLSLISGGKSDLQPETSKQKTIGVVWEPTTAFNISADVWEIDLLDQLRTFSRSDLTNNYALFSANFIRDGAGNLVAIDQRWTNAGQTLTRGIDLVARANGKLMDGIWNASLDGSMLLTKEARARANLPFGPSQIGQFNLGGDPGIRWKHTASLSFIKGDWTYGLSQVYRDGYKNRPTSGVLNAPANFPQFNYDVDPLRYYNISVGYKGIQNLSLTAGIKNLFNVDPPIANNHDDNTGGGSAWDPRVADPRGRSFTLSASYKFF